MKDLVVTLLGIIVSLLLIRYYPYTSRTLVLEYISAAYLYFKSGKSINNDAADLSHA